MGRARVPESATSERLRSRAKGTRARLWVIAWLSLGLAVVGCAGQDGDTLARAKSTGLLRVATDATYPPFETVDAETGEIVGFDVDLIHAIAGRLGVQVELEVVPFDGILAGLRSGKYDAVISCLTITEDRARQVLFSEPYHSAGQSVCVRSNSSIRGPADLSGRRIGVQLGTTGERAAHRIDDANVVSFDAIGAALIDLRNGHLDAVIVDTPTGLLFSREHPEIRTVGEPITQESYGIAFRKGDESLKHAVDAVLQEFEGEGRIHDFRKAWGLEPL